MTETEGKSVPAPKSKTPAMSDWTPDDMKMLAVTVIATVTANLITILLAALTFIAARYARSMWPTPGSYALFSVLAVVSAAAIRLAIKNRTLFLRGELDRYGRIAFITCTIFCVLLLLFFALAAIGIAANIK
jgi:hypothetical protein